MKTERYFKCEPDAKGYHGTGCGEYFNADEPLPTCPNCGSRDTAVELGGAYREGNMNRIEEIKTQTPWEIWIDDLEGNLAMDKNEGARRMVCVYEDRDIDFLLAEVDRLRAEGLDFAKSFDQVNKWRPNEFQDPDIYRAGVAAVFEFREALTCERSRK